MTLVLIRVLAREFVMIIFLQYPITDFRRFLPDETYQVGSPTWPNTAAYRQFVRSFGQVKERRKGGVVGWVGEHQICDARNGLKLDLNGPAFRSSQGKIHLRCQARYFYFDGRAVGKLTLVFATKPKNIHLSRNEIDEFADYILNIPAKIRFLDGSEKKATLFSIRDAIAELYLYSSSKTNRINRINQDWVTCGIPLMYCELGSGEVLTLNKSTKTVDLALKLGLTISQKYIQKGRNKGVQLIFSHYQNQQNLTIDKEKARLLRICLMRLSAEYSSMGMIVKKVPTIVDKQSLKESDALQDYINTSTKRITMHNKKIAENSENNQVSDLALNTLDLITPGERSAFLNALQNIRPQVLRKIDELTKEKMLRMEVEMYKPKTWEKIIIYAAGVLFIGLIAFLVIRNEPIEDKNFVIFIRIILSTLLAAMGATIPGMLNVNLERKGVLIRASGALALFVITYLLAPTVL